MKTKLCAPHDTRGKIIYGTNNPNYCYKTLPIEKFTWENKSKGLRRHACSSCRYKYEMKRYDKNPEAKQLRSESIVKATKKRRTQLQSKVNEIKSNSPCVDCGGSFHPIAMDFDHVRGTKKYGISKMVAKCMPEDKILKEIERIERKILCLDCLELQPFRVPTTEDFEFWKSESDRLGYIQKKYRDDDDPIPESEQYQNLEIFATVNVVCCACDGKSYGSVKTIEPTHQKALTQRDGIKEPARQNNDNSFCDNCGKSLKPTAKFCGSCGNQV